MQIVKADTKDYPAVREFYYALTDEMEQAEFTNCTSADAGKRLLPVWW